MLSTAFHPISIPFILILISQIAFFFGKYNPWHVFGLPLSTYVTIFRTLALSYLLLLILARSGRIPSRIWAYLVLLGVVFAYSASISFDLQAAKYAFGKYVVPIAALLFGYLYQRHLPIMVRAFLLMVAANDLFQVYLTVSYYSGLPTSHLWFKSEVGLLRASGFCDVAPFAFSNLAAALLSYHLLHRKHWAAVFLAFSLHTIAIKTVAMIAFYFAVRVRDPWVRLVAIVGCCTAVLILLCHDPTPGQNSAQTVSQITTIAQKRIDGYVRSNESARRESYRVMYESLAAGNLFGEGLGCFGGPASTVYDSPTYDKYDYRWYGCAGMATTDTYYPHVFVELGLLGGLVFILHVFLPWFSWRGPLQNLMLYRWLLFALLWESVGSYAMEDFTYVMSSTVLFFALNSVGTTTVVGTSTSCRVTEQGQRAATHPPRSARRPVRPAATARPRGA